MRSAKLYKKVSKEWDFSTMKTAECMGFAGTARAGWQGWGATHLGGSASWHSGGWWRTRRRRWRRTCSWWLSSEWSCSTSQSCQTRAHTSNIQCREKASSVADLVKWGAAARSRWCWDSSKCGDVVFVRHSVPPSAKIFTMQPVQSWTSLSAETYLPYLYKDAFTILLWQHKEAQKLAWNKLNLCSLLTPP